MYVFSSWFSFFKVLERENFVKTNQNKTHQKFLKSSLSTSTEFFVLQVWPTSDQSKLLTNTYCPYEIAHMCHASMGHDCIYNLPRSVPRWGFKPNGLSEPWLELPILLNSELKHLVDTLIFNLKLRPVPPISPFRAYMELRYPYQILQRGLGTRPEAAEAAR